jgi:hypothetical protein
MTRSLRPRFLLAAAPLALAAAVVAVGPFAAPAPLAAKPKAPDAATVTALQYVPADAALFLHADVNAVWNHEAVKGFRAADKNTFGRLEDDAAKALGSKLTDLKTLTFFVPTLKQPQDMEQYGVVLTFANAYDKKKLTAGVEDMLPKNAKVNVVAASDTVAVVLVGLDGKYGKPKPPGGDGPLSGALASAASGKHTLVAGATLASMPDELQADNLPGQVRPLQPLFRAETLVATVDLGKSLDLSVRVKTKREAQAVDAEKAMAALVKMLADEADRELPDFEKDAGKDMGMKDVVAVLKATLTAAKGAKFAVDGTEARGTISLPLNGLPLASAYSAAALKVQSAAAVQRSANNLKQIALAMHNYHDATGAFPPAAVCDKNGKPQLSWRVLILPYIEQDALYKQFKLDEPWDSENNKKLIDKMPNVYAMPGKARPGDTTTYYRVFVGNGAGFDWVAGKKIVNITDGTSNTFMCVTAADPVVWTKPDELEFDPEKDMTKLMGLVVNGKAQVAMYDGSVRSLAKIPAKETLHALITAAGGEVVPDF